MAEVIAQPGGTVLLNDIVRIQYFSYLEGQIGITGCDYRCRTPPVGSVSYGEVAKAWYDLVQPIIQTLQSNAVQQLGARASWLYSGDPLRFPPTSGVVTDTSLGGAGVLPVPTQAAALLQKRTLQRGPDQRGRMYLAFFDSSMTIDGQNWSAGCMGNMQNLADAIGPPAIVVIGVGGSVTLTPGIYHRWESDAVPPAPPPADWNWFSLISSIRAEQGIATQKRRGTFGKPNPPVIPR